MGKSSKFSFCEQTQVRFLMMERWSKYNAFFMFFESHCTNLVRSSALVYLWTSVRSSEISSSTQHYLGPFGKSMWSSGCWDRYRHKELWHIPDYTVLRQIPKKVQFEKDSKTRHFFFFFKKYKRFTALKELTFKRRVKKKCWFSVLRYYYKSNKHTPKSFVTF